MTREYLSLYKQHVIMTVSEIMTDLQANGSESIKKILLKHGIKEPFFGVKG
jgi:hypothetical protein